MSWYKAEPAAVFAFATAMDVLDVLPAYVANPVVILVYYNGFAAVAQRLRGVFYCCAAVRQFVADRAVVDCWRGGIVQGPLTRCCKEAGLMRSL
ncbi:hypothetical protein Nepgr_008010 [Nepenthes gracilis]|uniref:Uncharacterized protein n=1 Tax=Nepenthes gracilis TaxID=150966 RepID=A0AAD3S807_NEPGR|nr:hypothetical protein Nepgr_008010 [Nepenthes gracilis]